MKLMKINNLMNKILVVFLIIQPIFDIKPFYNSISTLIRVIIIYALFAYYFFNSKSNKKYWLLLYPALVGIYFVFHHINATKFNSLVPGNFNYSIVKEALYFVKMISPFLLIYCLFKANISKDTIVQIIKYLVLIISLIIVITNLLGISYGSYSDEPIKANFFEWFNSDSDFVYQDLASKGLFEYGNQISAILIMFLPFTIYLVIERRKLNDFFTAILNVFALTLICTKVSVFGIAIVIVYTIFTFAFISFIFKKQFVFKNYIPIGVIVLVYCLLLPVNPMFSRLQERATISEISDLDVKNEVTYDIPETFESTVNNTYIENEQVHQNFETSINSQKQQMLEYIEANFESKQLHKPFLFEYYPYQYDPEFWYNILQNEMSFTTDYRFIEISIIQRVIAINNNSMDKWFGITNTRLQNIFNIERDFVVQYYALGIIGTILVLAPYFILLGYFAYSTFKHKFKNLNVINLLAVITIVFLFVISYFSGNLLNSLSFTIYFTLCFYLIICLLF